MSLMKTEKSCPLAKKCGGCQMQNKTYEEQLHIKQCNAIRLLGRYGHVKEIIGMDQPYHYRHKVQAAFGFRNHQIISGVYQSSTHKIVPVDHCQIEDEKCDEIIVFIRSLLQKYHIHAFDDERMNGFLRHVLIRKGYRSGQILVVLVTYTKPFPHSRDFVIDMVTRFPEITTIVQNVNHGFTSLVLGKENIPLYGEGVIHDSLLGKSFRISPNSFFQVNPCMVEKVYKKALDMAHLTGKENVIDAYCGTGTIGLLAAEKAGNVLGIESVPEAVKDAHHNQQINRVGNIRFLCDDATKVLNKMALQKEKVDVLFMDPPRQGSTSLFIRSVAALQPEKVVYISCNPETLARDLHWFSLNHYHVKEIQPFDMFPFTQHVETVVLLQKAKTKLT